jgi:hypothetical protein
MSKKHGNDFDRKLEKIANLIADQVIGGGGEDGLALEQKIAAFKELKNYYYMLKKINPEENSGSFGGFGEKIAELGKRRRNGAVDVEPGADPEF